MIEKIFDYDIEDVLSTYEYELENIIVNEDLFYDIRVIKEKVSYPQISLTPVNS